MANRVFPCLLVIILLFGLCNCQVDTSKSDLDDDPKAVTDVFLVFMNHLDVGFAGLLDDIVNLYFHFYFPQAATLANNLRKHGYVERFVYLTHPWLVSMYIDCPKYINVTKKPIVCPKKAELDVFNTAVKNGDITWHAGPMNMQNEFMDQSLFEFSLQLSEDLDKSFGIKRKMRVIRQTDVPGTTVSVIPSMLKMGVSGISVGVNAATAPPALPKIFRWQYGNSSVVATWHGNGYPNPPGKYPASPGGLSANDCVILGGKAQCFAFRSDNAGPPTSEAEVLKDYEIVRGQFPNAKIRASNLEDFFIATAGSVDKLPIVKQEVGDTWIQGIQSDPKKVAEFRTVLRLRTECIKTGKCSYSDHRFYNSSRLFLKTAEHTWGSNNMYDRIDWSNPKFEAARNNSAYQKHELSWKAQRTFSYIGVEALGDHPLANRIKEAWKDLEGNAPILKGYKRTNDLSYTCKNGMKITFNNHGAITYLLDPRTKLSWASPERPLAQYLYQSYNQTDFDRYYREYVYTHWFDPPLEKPNITANAHPDSKDWLPKLVEFYIKENASCEFLAMLKMPDNTAVKKYGSPATIWLNYSVPENSKRFGVDIELLLLDKTTTRMPEGLFFNFYPPQKQGYKWTMSKLGHIVDPMSVVVNGSQRHHVVDDNGVWYTDASNNGIQFVSLDVGIATTVTKMQPTSAFPLPVTRIDAMTGVSFNIFNNVWDCNYIFWYPFNKEDKNIKSRYSINLLQRGH